MFPEAGEADKMYFVDTMTDPETKVRENMTLELSANTDGVTSEVRPIFDLANSLSTEWFKFSEDKTWFVYVREGDDFMALMEYEDTATDYRLATGTDAGKFLQSQGSNRALVRDFDPKTNVLSYLTEDKKFK